METSLLVVLYLLPTLKQMTMDFRIHNHRRNLSLVATHPLSALEQMAMRTVTAFPCFSTEQQLDFGPLDPRSLLVEKVNVLW